MHDILISNLPTGKYIDYFVERKLEYMFLSDEQQATLDGAKGETMARVMKTPTTTFLVPSIIPLIPGSALYYTMNYALNKQWSEFVQQAFYTLQLALSLAVGIIAVTTAVRLLTALLRNRIFHHSIK